MVSSVDVGTLAHVADEAREMGLLRRRGKAAAELAPICDAVAEGLDQVIRQPFGRWRIVRHSQAVDAVDGRGGGPSASPSAEGSS